MDGKRNLTPAFMTHHHPPLPIHGIPTLSSQHNNNKVWYGIDKKQPTKQQEEEREGDDAKAAAGVVVVVVVVVVDPICPSACFPLPR